MYTDVFYKEISIERGKNKICLKLNISNILNLDSSYSSQIHKNVFSNLDFQIFIQFDIILNIIETESKNNVNIVKLAKTLSNLKKWLKITLHK